MLGAAVHLYQQYVGNPFTLRNETICTTRLSGSSLVYIFHCSPFPTQPFGTHCMSQFHIKSLALVLLILWVGGGNGALAQEVGRVGSVTASGVPYFIYAEAGEPTIQVNVVGGGAGGIYEVGADLRFDEFLTLATLSPGVQGGTRQQITVRLYRTIGTQRQLVIEQDVQELLAANPDTYPELQEGDFVNIEIRTRQRFGWRDALRIVTSASSIILLVDRLARVF